MCCEGCLTAYVGPDAHEPITSMAMEGKAVWAASGPDVIKYLRGKEVRTPLYMCKA